MDNWWAWVEFVLAVIRSNKDRRMRDFILDDELFSAMVMRCRDGRELPITVNNWQEIKDAIELSVYRDSLHDISLRPTDDECNDFLEVNGDFIP